MERPLRADVPSDRPIGRTYSALNIDGTEPVELADRLEQLLDATTEETCDSDLISAYLDALDRAAPMPEGKSAADALKDLQGKLRVVNGEVAETQAHVSKHRGKRCSWVRSALAAAAAAALMLGLLVTVQAAGVDILGAIARWTDETFGIYIITDERTALIRDTFTEYGIPLELAPAWLPEDYAIQEIECYENQECDIIIHRFFREEEEFRIQVWEYNDPVYLNYLDYEKNVEHWEEYISRQHTFYLFKNNEENMASWSDGNTIIIDFGGKITENDLKKIIDSMGG